jgi:hypothetical protein
MFKRRTLFIVGAGASQEAGFPMGATLATRIGNNLKVEGGAYAEKRPSFHDHELFYELQRYLGQDQRSDLGKYWEAAQLINAGIGLSNSIDDFLNIHSENPFVTKLGKAGIVRVILAAEQESALYVNPSNINNKLDSAKVEQAWFVKLMRVLGSGGRPDSVESIFKNIAFITFNYDRCIEHFFAYALSALYGITRKDAEEIVKKITIIHPYGKIGELDALPFGGDPNNSPSLFPLAERIKTYAEQFEEGEDLIKMRDEMHNAACIVFLGFSYLEQNMTLLRPPNPMDVKTVLGTAYKLSSSDSAVVTREILGMFGEPQAHEMRQGQRILIDNAITCSQLFDTYARTLNAA